MRSFTNRTGDKVEVTQEHLDNALAIYEELSKNSPSGKVSWRKLKKMMIEDGFENASEGGDAVAAQLCELLYGLYLFVVL